MSVIQAAFRMHLARIGRKYARRSHDQRVSQRAHEILLIQNRYMRGACSCELTLCV
jgi:hypothetical protein